MRTKLSEKRISEMNEQFTLGNIDLTPSYQRRPVWSIKAKTYLIDTILRNLPIPKFFFQIKIDSKTGKTQYDVVDGQQRLTAIFEFIKGEYVINDKTQKFLLLKKNHPKDDTFDDELEGKGFTDLDKRLQDSFWSYALSFEELEEAEDQEIRDMFVRLNLSGEKLKDQELRHAAYDGDFKRLVYRLSDDHVDELVSRRVISASQVKRMADAELISELLAAILKGIQDKKKNLDRIYSENDSMEDDDVKELKEKFTQTWKLLTSIVDEETFVSSRFKKKNDFYSLFYLFYYLKFQRNLKFPQENVTGLRDTLIKFSKNVSIDSESSDFRTYNDSTLQAGDSISHRSLRHDFLIKLIEPFFVQRDPNRKFTEFEREFMWHSSIEKKCAICGEVINSYQDYELDHKESWDNGGPTTIANAQISHSNCNKIKSNK